MKHPERVKKGRATLAKALELLIYYLAGNPKEITIIKEEFDDLDDLISNLSMDQKTYGNYLAKKIKKDMNRSEKKKKKKKENK